MAVEIPRSGPMQPQETQRREVIQDDGGAAGMRQVADGLNKMGQMFRESQRKLDIAEAETRITAAERMAEAEATEQGLWGKDYADFMSQATSKARDEALKLTDLPEVRRELSNAGMVGKETDLLRYEAEGRKREMTHLVKRHEANVDMNAKDANTFFHLMANGYIDDDGIKKINNARISAEGITNLVPGERGKLELQSGSAVARALGIEINRGHTRGDIGRPEIMHKILTTDPAKLDGTNLEFYNSLTDADRQFLIEDAERALDSKAAGASLGTESASQRIDEIARNVEEAQKNGSYIPYDDLMRELPQHIGVIRNYIGFSQNSYLQPYIGKYASKFETGRQKAKKGEELLTGLMMWQSTEGATQEQLQHLDLKLTAYAKSGEMPESLLYPGQTIDTVIATVDNERVEMVTGESRQLEAARHAVKQRLQAMKSQVDSGDSIKETILSSPSESLIASYTGEDLLMLADAKGISDPQSLGPSDLAAMLSGEEDASENFGSLIAVGNLRKKKLSDDKGRTGSYGGIYNANEINSVFNAFKNGDIGDKQFSQFVNTLADLPDEALRKQIDIAGDKRELLSAFAYVSQLDKKTGKTNLLDTASRGVQVMLQTEGGFQSSVFWEPGHGQNMREYTSIVMDSLGKTSENIKGSLKQLVEYSYIGQAESSAKNRFSKDKAKEIVGSIFPNGVSWSGDRFLPNASDSKGNEVSIYSQARRLTVDDFGEGKLFPAFALSDDVNDEYAEWGGTERIIQMIADGEAILTPDLDNPGSVFVSINESLSPVIMQKLFTPKGYLKDSEGKIMRLNFNNIDQRRG